MHAVCFNLATSAASACHVVAARVLSDVVAPTAKAAFLFLPGITRFQPGPRAEPPVSRSAAIRLAAAAVPVGAHNPSGAPRLIQKRWSGARPRRGRRRADSCFCCWTLYRDPGARRENRRTLRKRIEDGARAVLDTSPRTCDVLVRSSGDVRFYGAGAAARRQDPVPGHRAQNLTPQA